MSQTVLIWHYILWGALLITAGFTLRAYRGASLLSIFSVSLALQVGTLAATVSDFDILGIDFTTSAQERMGISLIISYAILIFFLLGELGFHRRPRCLKTLSPVAIPRFWRVVGLALVVGIVAVRSFSATGRAVLQHGVGTIGTPEYYDLRVELIDLGNENLSRLANYFEAFARQILFLMLIIAALELAEKRTARRIAFYLILLAGLFFNGLLMLQKTPIMLVLVAGGAPLLLATLRKKRSVSLRFALRMGVVIGVIMAASVGLYSVTEGSSLSDSLTKPVVRIFAAPCYATLMHFEVFPDTLNHMYWTDLTPVRLLLDKKSLMPGDDSISVEVAYALTGNRFNANASAVGEGWACAGFGGVALEITVMAAFCFLTDQMTLRAGKGISLLPLAIYYWLGFASFGNVAVFPCIIQHALFLVPAFYCLVLSHRTGSKKESLSVAPAIAPLDGVQAS